MWAGRESSFGHQAHKLNMELTKNGQLPLLTTYCIGEESKACLTLKYAEKLQTQIDNFSMVHIIQIS